MSLQRSSAQLGRLLDDARLLAAQTASHQEHLEGLAALTELSLRHAEVLIAQALTGEALSANIVQIRRSLRERVTHCADEAAATRHLCEGARAQRAVACRLLAQLDDDEQADERRTGTVLVVDDYGDIRELVARILENAGFFVRTASNGLEGLLAAHEMRPDVIVMDVSMPVLDGIEATRLIKAGEATRDARVIAYTASPVLDRAVTQKLFAAVLRKPAAPDVVLATVQHVAGLSC